MSWVGVNRSDFVYVGLCESAWAQKVHGEDWVHPGECSTSETAGTTHPQLTVIGQWTSRHLPLSSPPANPPLPRTPPCPSPPESGECFSFRLLALEVPSFTYYGWGSRLLIRVLQTFILNGRTNTLVNLIPVYMITLSVIFVIRFYVQHWVLRRCTT